MPPAAPQLRPIDPPPAPARSWAEPVLGVLDLRATLAVLRRRLWQIAAVTLLATAAGGIFTLRQPKQYTARATIVIEAQAPKVLGDQVQDVADSQAPYWQIHDFVESYLPVLRSKSVAARVAARLGLERDADFLGLADLADPAERAQAVGRADAAALLQQRTRIEPERNSFVVRLAIEDRSPQRAALLANAFADEFVAFNLDQRQNTSRAASEWLHGQIEELQRRLARSETALFEFKRENDILTATLEDSQSIVGRRLAAVNDALTQVRRQRAEAEAKVALVRSARAAGSQAGLPQVIASQVVQALRARAVGLSEELAEALARYGAEHPRIAALRGRQQEATELLLKEEERIAGAAEMELTLVRDTERNLESLLGRAKREAFEVNRKEVDFSRLRRDQDNNAKVVELVLRRLKDVDLSAMLRANNVRVLDAAEVPQAPSSPNLKLALLGSLLLGLLVGTASALLLENLDTTLKGQEDLEAATGATFLGLVPIVPDESGGAPELHVHRQPQSSAAECLRTVRTNLLFLATERPLQKLLVTSSGPQEGKTTVCVDLGVTFAQSSQRVLLVDTDLRRPRLHVVFGLGRELGLTSVLLDESRLGEAVRATEVPGLWVLPCGPIPPNPAELLHTERFRSVVAELCRRFDRIIFDSPPVAAVTDAQILSSEVDGVILIGRAGRTTRDALTRSRRQLVDVGARIVGAVLNRVDLADRSGYYYDYYGRYGAYHDGRPANAESAPGAGRRRGDDPPPGPDRGSADRPGRSRPGQPS
jgi:capsular exopolysaccharide synthesis family protein